MSFAGCSEFVRAHGDKFPGKNEFGLALLYWTDHDEGFLAAHRARQTLRDTRRDEALNKQRVAEANRVAEAGAKRDAVDALLAKISEMGCIVPEVDVRRCNTNDLMYATQLVEDAAECAANGPIPPHRDMSCDPYWSSKRRCVARRVRWNLKTLGDKLLNACEIKEFFDAYVNIGVTIN